MKVLVIFASPEVAKALPTKMMGESAPAASIFKINYIKMATDEVRISSSNKIIKNKTMRNASRNSGKRIGIALNKRFLSQRKVMNRR